ncbi:hypothetical protein PV10_02611 [Exophiala mesophila]|uniref:Transcription factor domain-containing protein n=1 Tax=Exophiala mesophila TaxID=212818 RepID=A0A0D1WZD5_EXOME|nr:uncharacterized protein PV10_02611 [Exophiala mesophila]KIV94890.1 hypothetical protein PV10_02611 [Exophiala mesophila]
MPPKGKQPQSPDSPFLFVNEDASTVNRTTKDAQVDRTKQSHVQRQNFMRKRRLREGQDTQRLSSNLSPPATSPATPIVSQDAPPSSTSAFLQGHGYFDHMENFSMSEAIFSSTSPQSPSDVLDPRLFGDPFGSQASSPMSSVAPLRGFDALQIHQVTPSFESLRLPYGPSSPPPISMSGATTPMLATQMTSSPPATDQRILEQWAPHLIRHYNTVVLPEKFWLDTRKVSMGRMRHAGYIHADMQTCMAESAHLYAYLASAATHMIVREGRLLLPGASDNDARHVCTFFKTKAIRALRARLGTGYLDNRLAMDVHRLYSSTILFENVEAAEPHFHALISMIEQLGGTETFDDYQLETLIHVDLEAAMRYCAMPRLAVDWDPGPLSEEQMHMIEGRRNRHGNTASGFEEICRSENIYLSESDTFADLVQLVDMSNYLMEVHDYERRQQKWLNRRYSAILNRILSSLFFQETDDTSCALKIATVIWLATSSSFHLKTRGTWASTLVPMIRQRLEATNLERSWRPHTEVLLWIATFAGICACACDAHDAQWFTNLAKETATSAGINNLTALEDLFSRFLYDPLAQRSYLVNFSRRMWGNQSS